MDAAALLPARGALIGLDLGTKTIGVASSDPDRRLATPVETVARQRFSLDAQRLLDLAAERRAVCFVPVSYTHLDVYKRQARAGCPQGV